MKRFLVLSVFVFLLIIICSAILIPGTETAAQELPTPEATKPGYTNYSGYYRMRCWPACHTKDIPESMKPKPRGYTNYSGYYRMRCWPACHTRDIPESVKKSMEARQGK